MCQWQEPSCLRILKSCAHKSPSKFWKQISRADKSKINYQNDEITNSGEVKRHCAGASDVQNGSAVTEDVTANRSNRMSSSAKNNTCHRYQKYNCCRVTIRKTVSLSKWFQKRLFHVMCWHLKWSVILQSSLTVPRVNAPGPGTRDRFFSIGVMMKMHVWAKAENTPGWGASSSQGPKISLNVIIKF